MSVNFGEQGRRLSYGSYLRVPELIELQSLRTEAPDELLFIVVHQTYELWFRLILHELEMAQASMDLNEIEWARHYLKRVAAIEDILVSQVKVLDTMAPQDFLQFRSELAPASGFQSVQFREIEFLSGLKDPGYLDRVEMTAEEGERLRRRLDEPSLWDSFIALLERSGVADVEELFDRKGEAYELFELAEALLDHDQAISLWRMRHVLMVERQIGAKTGTGGSTGASYLRSTLDKRFFPALWESRTELI